MLRLNPNSQIDNGGNCDHQMLDSNMDNISMDALLGHNQGSRKKREGNHQCFLRVSDLKICVAIGVFVIYIYIYYLFIVYINNIYIFD